MIWKLSTDERLRKWKQFRNSLGDHDLPTALAMVDEFWRSVPFSPYYLDPTRPEDWPDPWTMITENYYCDVAKALGMLYTVALSSHKTNSSMRIYHSRDQHKLYNLAWFEDGKYVLNMTDDGVVNKSYTDQKSLILKFEYSDKQLKLDSY